MKCYGCGAEKDPTVLETYPYDELDTTEPGVPLLVLEVQPEPDMDVSWKAAVVCYECFHKLQPDMWINERMWGGLKPRLSFAELPSVIRVDTEIASKMVNRVDWRPEIYPGL